MVEHAAPAPANAADADALADERAQQYRAIFEASSDGLVINDLESGVVLAANPAFCRMHGYADMTGLHPTTFIHPDSHHLFEAYCRAIRNGREYRTRALDVRRDGTVFDVEVMGRGLVFQGRFAMLGVVRDVTEQVHAQKLLEQRVAERTREIERRRQVAEALRDLLAVVNSGRTLDEILRHVTAQSSRTLGCDASGIYVPTVEDREPLLEVRAGDGLGLDLVRVKIPVGAFATGLAFEMRRPVANTDVLAVPADEREVGRGFRLEDRGSHLRVVHVPVA